MPPNALQPGSNLLGEWVLPANCCGRLRSSISGQELRYRVQQLDHRARRGLEAQAEIRPGDRQSWPILFRADPEFLVSNRAALSNARHAVSPLFPALACDLYMSGSGFLEGQATHETRSDFPRRRDRYAQRFANAVALSEFQAIPREILRDHEVLNRLQDDGYG